MTFKFFVLAAIVAVVAISVNAQTTGSSSGDLLGGLGTILAGPLKKIVNNLVQIITSVGNLLDGDKTLIAGLEAVLTNLLQVVCRLLQLVGQILQSIVANFSLDKTAVDTCARIQIGAVSGQPGASTSGPLGGI